MMSWAREEALQLKRNRQIRDLFESKNNKIWGCLGGSDG